MKWAGIFADDPTFVPMMKGIYKDRAGAYEEGSIHGTII
jgi:hypothetical protein